nr:hypothetical protein GCM10020241_45320 [Streptoalloteichus tenebrarius]
MTATRAYRSGVAVLPFARSVSILATTSASQPRPALKVNQRAGLLALPAHPAEADPAAGALLDGAQQVVRGLDRVARQPQRPGEDVGRPAGDDTEHGRVVPDPLGQQPVDHLVDGAVAPVRHHQVEPGRGGLAGRVRGVAPVVGLQHVQLHRAGQGVGEHVPSGGRGGGGLGVDHEQGAHESSVGQGRRRASASVGQEEGGITVARGRRARRARCPTGARCRAARSCAGRA